MGNFWTAPTCLHHRSVVIDLLQKPKKALEEEGLESPLRVNQNQVTDVELVLIVLQSMGFFLKPA